MKELTNEQKTQVLEAIKKKAHDLVAYNYSPKFIESIKESLDKLELDTLSDEIVDPEDSLGLRISSDSGSFRVSYVNISDLPDYYNEANKTYLILRVEPNDAQEFFVGVISEKPESYDSYEEDSWQPASYQPDSMGINDLRVLETETVSFKRFTYSS